MMPELAKSQTSLGLKDGSNFAPVPELAVPENLQYMLEVRNVVKRYGSVIAVNGVTFCVAYGEIFGLLGPNGAGKTTTIRMLTTLTKPTAGEIYVAGYSVQKDPVNVKKQRFGLAMPWQGCCGDCWPVLCFW